MNLEQWEAANSKAEEYYHGGQYHKWVVRDNKVVEGTGDTKAEAHENLCGQLGVDP